MKGRRQGSKDLRPLTRPRPPDTQGPSSARYRVLLIGASGAFGSRLAELLAQSPALHLALMARARAPLEALASRLRASGHGAALDIVAADRGSGIDSALARFEPHLVIDASGPFVPGDYGVAKAALRAGANYVDLADNRDFVCGIGALNAAARGYGLFALSGLSSVPALSGAIVRMLSQGLTDVGEIHIAIAPGNRAPKGLAVVRSVLGSAGKPMTVRRAGQDREIAGWSGLKMLKFSAGSRKPLLRWVSEVDVPDLVLWPRRYPGVRSVRFFAGLELRWLHFGLWLGAKAVAGGWLTSLAPFAKAAKRLADAVEAAGTDEGGMLVSLTGRTPSDSWVSRTWTLIAGSGHGPYIPAVAAAIVARKAAIGQLPPPGARPADAALEAEEFERLFSQFDITTERREAPVTPPLFARILGSDLALLPAPIRAMHASEAPLLARGEARVDRGAGPLGQLIGWLFSFPPPAERTPVRVTMEAVNGGELWVREFGTGRFRSFLTIETGPARPRLGERFGPFRFDMDVEASAAGLRLLLRRARLFGLPWPLALSPRIKAGERVEDGKFVFDVRVDLPIAGFLVQYRGWLVPVAPGEINARTSQPAVREPPPGAILHRREAR